MMREKLTCRKFVEYLFPELANVGQLNWRCPPWPPDAFAICIALLEKSGAYTSLGCGDCCPVQLGGWQTTIERCEAILDVAREWQEKIELVLGDGDSDLVDTLCGSTDATPEVVNNWWAVVCDNLEVPVVDISKHQLLVASLINIVSSADEAVAGVGINMRDSTQNAKPSEFWRACSKLLDPNQDLGSTLCAMISPTTLRTLPKAQTPTSGLSIRSLSHYISMFPPVNVTTRWYEKGIKRDLIDSHCNLLLVPWPFKIKQSQFSTADVNEKLMPINCRAFDFHIPDEPSNAVEVLQSISQLIDQAESQVGSIHAVVLPETSVTLRQFELLRSQLVCQRNVMLIAGVSDSTDSRSKNLAMVSAPSDADPNATVDYSQAKHHRWKLDADQIERYGLTGCLNPEFSWWESFDIAGRAINFMHPTDWLTLCVLLCEDLAQFDPVGRAVRAVGPDLVICLLMDGPQLVDRWPARYATVLADDPGSAVLTLTSLGMAELSRLKRATAAPVPRTIALWKDPIKGTVAIELPKDATAAILTIKSKESSEFTADGRQNGLKLGAPVFGGVTFV